MGLPSSPFFFFYVFLLSFSFINICHGQQAFINNKQFSCRKNNATTLGFLCNGEHSCTSFLIFRSQPPYNTPVHISYLLKSDADKIAEINGLTVTETIPTNTLVIVPVDCSCSGGFYQYNSSYKLGYQEETYFTIANNTYQGLTTCQALLDQNNYSRSLNAGKRLSVPLRCACPTKNQTEKGIKFLVTYLITWGDRISKISERFGVDKESVLEANSLSLNSTIFPFNTLLIPMKTIPTKNITSQTPSLTPKSSSSPVSYSHKQSNMKWIFIGVGTGLCLLSLIGFLVCLLFRWYRKQKLVQHNRQIIPTILSKDIRDVVEFLSPYRFKDLETSTNNFDEDHRIKGSVYRGVLNGTDVAIKRIEGDVSKEIKVLNQINHSNVIKLSGFCFHRGYSYLIYELAENGSLYDWLHEKSDRIHPLSWMQRVQIAYDVAEGLNYLHNYANPSYVHRDLKSSTILLDRNFRAKVSNFGMARSINNGGRSSQLTKHVMGTKGYMAPEYLQTGLITTKIDVFSMGVVLLELLSGKDATAIAEAPKPGDSLLSECIQQVFDGENVQKLKNFMDKDLKEEYPLDTAFKMAQLAVNCVYHDPYHRPAIAEVCMDLAEIFLLSKEWENYIQELSTASAISDISSSMITDK